MGALYIKLKKFIAVDKKKILYYWTSYLELSPREFKLKKKELLEKLGRTKKK